MFIVSPVNSRHISYCVDNFFQNKTMVFQVPFAGIITGFEKKQEGLPIFSTNQAWSLDHELFQASMADPTARG